MRELRFRTRRGFKFRDHDDDDDKGIPGGDDLDPLLRPDDNNHVRFIRAVVARNNNNNNINNNVQQQQQANAPAMLPRQRREHHAHHPVRAGVPFRERMENNRRKTEYSLFLFDLIREDLPCSSVLSGANVRGCRTIVERFQAFPEELAWQWHGAVGVARSSLSVLLPACHASNDEYQSAPSGASGCETQLAAALALFGNRQQKDWQW